MFNIGFTAEEHMEHNVILGWLVWKLALYTHVYRAGS